MKAKFLITIVIFLFFISVNNAQVAPLTDIQKQFKSLQVNSSPAYVILGVEPENIQRPNSPADFVANVQSATVNGKLQPNFAIETSPYYWSHPKTDSKKFNVVDYISNNNYWQNLAKSITFAFATSVSDSFTFGKIPVGTGFGVGMHLQLVQGCLSGNVRNNLLSWLDANLSQNILSSVIQKLESTNDNEIDDLDTWLDEKILRQHTYDNLSAIKKAQIKMVVENKLGENSLTAKNLSEIKKFRANFQKQSVKSLTKVNQDYQFPLTREGFMLEFAIANASIAQNGKWDSLTSAKTAIWLTPSYRFNVNKDPTVIDFIDAMAVARYTFNSKQVDSSNYFDFGGKLQWIHDKLSLSAEGVFRWLTNRSASQDKGYTFKTGVTFSYKLNELVTFKTTLGSNFDGNSTQYNKPSNMFIVGGFNFGFSNFFPSSAK